MGGTVPSPATIVWACFSSLRATIAYNGIQKSAVEKEVISGLAHRAHGTISDTEAVHHDDTVQVAKIVA